MSRMTEITIDRESGRVTLRSPSFGLHQPWNVSRAMIGRILQADCVKSVTLDRSKMTASIELSDSGVSSTDKGTAGLKEIVHRLRASAPEEDTISDEYSKIRRFELSKSHEGIIAGAIVHSVPGRIRIRHPLIRCQAGLSRIQRGLSSIPGVRDVSISSTTGSVLIHFEDQQFNRDGLLSHLEQLLTLDEDQIRLLKGPPASRWVASGTCLGLAIASEFVAPGLAPVTAAALVGFNIPTMVRGIGELLTFRWRVASLYTVIMGTTLISGQFLAAALMQASITCWHGWSSRRLRLIAERLQDQPQSPILLSRSHQKLLVNDQNFPECLIGTEVTTEQGNILPYDGIVVSGEGLLDEHSVRGDHAICRRKIGDTVFAGSLLIAGQLNVRVTAVEHQTRASQVRETLLNSIAELPGSGAPTQRGHASASRFVPLTFATGTAALMVGDLTTLAAVLRPDFATGPSMSERFGTLTSISHLWDRGWLVKHSEILHELAQTETVVIFRPATGDVDLSDSSHVRTRYVSLSARTLAIHEIESDEELCVDFVRELRRANRRVAVAACGTVLNQLANDDVVRISFTPEESLSDQSADIIALQSHPHEIEELWRIVQESRRPHQQGWAAVVGCNAVAISGAFLVGLTSLHVVVLTNLGALAAGLLYHQHVRNSSVLLNSQVPKGDTGERASALRMPGEVRPAVPGKVSNPQAGVSFRDSMNARIPPGNPSENRRWQTTQNIDPTLVTDAGKVPQT